MSDNIQKLKETLDRRQKSMIPVQTMWVTVKSVNWEEKTMTATGVMDGLDCFDVLLGLGSVYVKPKTGSKCLVGMMENQPAAWFLISAAEVEEVSVNADEIVFNGGGNGGVPISGNVSDRLNKVEKDINDLKQVFSTWVPAANDGGAALRGAAATWYAQQLQETQPSDIENEKIKH